MIVQCEKCGAKFQLADEKLTDKGVKVRCSKCKTVFTVTKGAKAKAEEEKPKAAPPPPKTAAPAAKPKAAPAGDDPFSDFQFSEDTDFSDDSGAATPPASAPASSAADSDPFAGADDISFEDEPLPPPKAATPPPPPKAAPPPPPLKAAPAADDGFDFKDEDFSMGGPEPAAEASASSKAADQSGTSYGDIKFDEESYSAPAAASSAGSDGEWGNVDMGDVAAEVKKPGGAEEFDDIGFGDFKFDADDKLPPGKSAPAGARDDDDGMDVVDFKRTPKSKSKSGDDYEASIGESETAEPQRRPEPKEEKESAPPPPKPQTQKAPSGPSPVRKFVKIAAILLVLLLIVFGGIVGYTNSKKWFTFDDLMTGQFKKLPEAWDLFAVAQGWKEHAPQIRLEFLGEPVRAIVKRDDNTGAALISGQIQSFSNKQVKEIKVQATLEGKDTNQLYTQFAYCGITFAEDNMKSWSKETLEMNMHGIGREIPILDKTGICDYQILFLDITESVGFKEVKIIGYDWISEMPPK